jgi:flagellar biosynthetic protein FliR
MGERALLATAVGFALALVRMTGFIIVSPFPGANVGRVQRAGLAAVLAVFVSPYVSVPDGKAAVDLTVAVTASTELLCGVVMGAAFRFLYVAAEFLGPLASQSVGLSMASVLNPSIAGEDTALSRALTLLAELLAISAGVHRTALAYLLHSFRLLPVGSTLSLSLTPMLVMDVAIRSMAIGLQLAMPVIGVGLMIHLGLAMIARAAPALQILHVGLGLVVAAGMMTLIASLPNLAHQLLAYYDSLAATLDGLLVALGTERP